MGNLLEKFCRYWAVARRTVRSKEHFFNLHSKICLLILFFNPHLRIYWLILEREEGRERQRNIDVREKHALAASLICPNQGPNPQPSSILKDAPTDWANLSGQKHLFFKMWIMIPSFNANENNQMEREKVIELKEKRETCSNNLEFGGGANAQLKR